MRLALVAGLAEPVAARSILLYTDGLAPAGKQPGADALGALLCVTGNDAGRHRLVGRVAQILRSHTTDITPEVASPGTSTLGDRLPSPHGVVRRDLLDHVAHVLGYDNDVC